jgi:solute:Na+ symporter, SSS family
LLGAYVSTIITHLNWGTSYVVHDCYRRFINPGADEKHYVMVGRMVTGLLMVAASLLTYALQSAQKNFDLMISVGAGTGLIYLLRWFWWRINAWSEIAAMVSSFAIAAAFFIADRMGHTYPEHLPLSVTVLGTTLVWLIVTYLTSPADRATLIRFYQLARPAGPGWNHIRAAAGVGPSPDSLPSALLGWVLGCLFVYSALFGAGSFLYGRTAQAILWTILFIASGIWLARLLPRFFSASSAKANVEPPSATTRSGTT